MPEEREISTNYEGRSTVAALLFDKGCGAEVDVRCWAKNPSPSPFPRGRGMPFSQMFGVSKARSAGHNFCMQNVHEKDLHTSLDRGMPFSQMFGVSKEKVSES